jgi:very-short-patch-repair endonuclease
MMPDEPQSRGSSVPSPLRGEGGAKRRVRGSVSRARSLRRNKTNPEGLLWSLLRGRRLGGHKFVRQMPIGAYVADFVCREAALIIELDGSQHLDSRHDEDRTAFLNAQGYSVLRVWNGELLSNPRGVAEGILAALDLHPSPGERFAPADLSPEGRGTHGASAATTKERSPRLNGALAHLLGKE